MPEPRTPGSGQPASRACTCPRVGLKPDQFVVSTPCPVRVLAWNQEVGIRNAAQVSKGRRYHRLRKTTPMQTACVCRESTTNQHISIFWLL